MSHDPARGENSWMDRFGPVSNRAALAAVIVAGLLGISHVFVLHATPNHLPVAIQGVLLALWGLTTLVALGGLAALGGAYSSLARSLKRGTAVDLDILPEDERRLLEYILDTPGITQVEVVARSDFSDAKVSQTLKALRERGLMYREPQGRTYRLYPGTAIAEPPSES